MNPEAKPHGILKPRVTVRLKRGVRSNAHLVQHQSYLLQRAYSCDLLDRRTTLGRMITAKEDSYARHHGFESFRDSPTILREDIRIAVRLWLYLATFVPTEDSKTGARDLKTTEAMLHRIYLAWGLRPTEKRIPDLQSYLGHLESEGEGDA